MTGATAKQAPKHSATTPPKQRHYLCIDLKSFYASVECVERGLDTMTTDLVVADESRTDKTICLAVSPSLKSKGVKNRCRLFEVPRTKGLIIAPPRMQTYIDYSANIYGVYLQYFSKDDIYPYSIDEVFIDVTDYLKMYQKTPRQMAIFLMNEVERQVGVRATAGVGTNLYLAKVALDILAKHAEDFVGELDEKSYQETLWDHQPITDFWRVGPGIARTLRKHRMLTMGDVAHADEDILYQLFGKNAELMIDHAWGREPVRLSDIKNMTAKTVGYSSTQVLPRNYTADEAVLVAREMMREQCLRLVDQHQLMSSVTLSLSGASNKTPDFSDADARNKFIRSFKRGTHHFLAPTSSVREATSSVEELFWKIADKKEKYRRIGISCNNVISENQPHQRSLFDEITETKSSQSSTSRVAGATSQNATKVRDADKKVQSAVIKIKNRYGKNAIFCGEDLESAATTLERNKQIGGHRSGK